VIYTDVSCACNIIYGTGVCDTIRIGIFTLYNSSIGVTNSTGHVVQQSLASAVASVHK